MYKEQTKAAGKERWQQLTILPSCQHYPVHSEREQRCSPTILSLQFVSLTAGETVTASIRRETGGGHIATDINKRLHLLTTTAPFS